MSEGSKGGAIRTGNSDGLRPPGEVMALEALSATKAHRLSFARTLIRKMCREQWKIKCSRFDVDKRGVGTVIYDIEANGHEFHFLIFSDNVPDANRTGRLSEGRFDGMAVLCHGPLTQEKIDLERDEIRMRSQGRTDWQSIGWTLASRSSRVFEDLVDSLANGQQPDARLLQSGGGYLFRNNGYYGNGRHGSRMWSSLPDNHPLGHPYHPEIFALYMWRHFGFELAERIARFRSPRSVQIDPEVRRYFGIGNATGQGMSTFVMKWPRWMHAWNLVREKAIARSLRQEATLHDVTQAKSLIARGRGYLLQHSSENDEIFLPPARLAAELAKIQAHLASHREKSLDWKEVSDWATSATERESVEFFHAVLTEIYGDEVEELDLLYKTEMHGISDVIPDMRVGQLLDHLRKRYAWALAHDLSEAGATQKFFYRSVEHGEQRVGDRFTDDGAGFETFTGVVPAAQKLATALAASSRSMTVARFLLEHPAHRFFVERVQSLIDCPYAEIQTNVTALGFQPVHAIRFVLATFGMETFTAHNNRWVQGTFFQGAPLAEELNAASAEDWLYPALPERSLRA